MEPHSPKTRAWSGNPTLVVCKPAFADVLRAEIAAEPRGDCILDQGRGWILVSGAPPARPWIFERQRLPGAIRLEGGSRRDLAQAAWAAFAERIAGVPWSVHAYDPDPGAAHSLQKRAAGIGAAFLERSAEEPAWRASYRDPDRTGTGDRNLRVVQLCLTERGLWGACTPLAALSAPWPGGVHRIADDPQAPSRSYMKIEEALACFGESPRAGQRVVDLGAAPGGWSYAFLRRGCRVVAVDRGALKLGSPEEWGGSLEHRREDGLRYRPAAPVDWLLSDMLIAPGVTLGLLRKWIGQGWARRFIVNVKLPQKEPFAALEPLVAFLEHEPGVEASLRQLHHDRREVTAWGRCHAAPQAKATPKPRRRR